MSVGLLIISHDGIGSHLLTTASRMLEGSPMRCRVLAAQGDSDPDYLVLEGKALIDQLDDGDGVLVLTDMFGATPSNVAAKLVSGKVACVAGINLPMLVRVLNYSELNLRELAQKALSGGIEGVMTCIQNSGE